MGAPSVGSSTKMRLASRSASLIARMSVICEPMWKCRSCRQSSMPSRAGARPRVTISPVVRPNFERSPVDSTHLPAPLVERRARTPITGRMSRSRAAARIGVQLAHAVDDDDDLAAELLRQQRGLDVRAVLVPVAEDERLGVVLQRERHQQLGLGAGLEPEVEGPPVLDQLLDDVALLVDLDRVDAAVGALVVVLGDRLLERAAELLDARAQDVGEADQEREVEAAAAQVVDQLLEVDAGRARPAGVTSMWPASLMREEVATPAVDVVELEGVLDRPGPELVCNCPPPPARNSATDHSRVQRPASLAFSRSFVRPGPAAQLRVDDLLEVGHRARADQRGGR